MKNNPTLHLTAIAIDFEDHRKEAMKHIQSSIALSLSLSQGSFNVTNVSNVLGKMQQKAAPRNSPEEAALTVNWLLLAVRSVNWVGSRVETREM